MNYLAHAYLSFNHPQILVGNLVSDFVKGKQQFLYSNFIQKGIQLHRAIDAFTDVDTATQKAKQLFKPQVGLYAGAFVDIAYDYFLANDKNVFTIDADIEKFAQSTYTTLYHYYQQLPYTYKPLLPLMQQQNWLYNYQFDWGIAKSFEGITRRAKYINKQHLCFNCFIDAKPTLQECYNDFFPRLKKFTANKFDELVNKDS